MTTLRERLRHVPQIGRLEAILLRVNRRGEVISVAETGALPGRGLKGDHRAEREAASPESPRQVTLIQAEHVPVVAALTGHEALDPALLRRNLVVSGVNLLALKDQAFYVGEVLLGGTGLCHPCTRMDEALGDGGLSAMRGHGGLTAKVLTGGTLRVGDAVRIKRAA